MTRLRDIRNTTLSLISLGIFAYLAYTVVTFVSTGVYALHLQNKKNFGTTAEMQLQAQERTFNVVCEKWRDAGFLERYTTYGDRAWCKDYLHRMN